MLSLKEFVGRVVEIDPKKAVVQFQLDGKSERAILLYDHLKVNGKLLPDEGYMDSYVQKDMSLKFLCHELDKKGVDRCDYFITNAWPYVETDVALVSNDDTVLAGLWNCTGTIQQISKRKGILSFSINGKDESVLFIGSKLWFGGKKVRPKAVLSSLVALQKGHPLMFDAVPCLLKEGRCGWFATVAWKGDKPLMKYDDANAAQDMTSLTYLEQIKLATYNPHSLFLRTLGQVMEIVSPCYGIALARIKDRHWESVLFHRSHVKAFGQSLATYDLQKIFKEGDVLDLVAAPAIKVMGVLWVASQVEVFCQPQV